MNTGARDGKSLFYRSSRMTRRALLAATVGMWLSRYALAKTNNEQDFAAQMDAMQARMSGRLGVYVLDTASSMELGFNHHERFAMCSTFKLPLAAAVLGEVDAGRLRRDRLVEFGAQDLMSHAPVTSARLAEGRMSVLDLCAAAVEVSDNPAANLLLALIGGPKGFTRFLRRQGDRITRLDRAEPELNTNLMGDVRDTTTPMAMAQTMRTLLLGAGLSAPSRAQLLSWTMNSTTGLRRIRAGLPADWRVGDKTGTGANGAVNDVAIMWPPGRSPILAAVYMSGSTLDTREMEAAHADTARLFVRMLTKQPIVPDFQGSSDGSDPGLR